MTIAEQIRRLDEAIVRESLEKLRADADRHDIVERVYTVPQDAVEAARWTRLRLRRWR